MTILRAILRELAILCSALLIAQYPYPIFAQPAPSGGGAQGQTGTTFTPQQLDSLVAPIALYPDPILSQVLVASTYPLEVVEAGRWVKQNPQLKGQALADAAKQQKWDASVQALVSLPDALTRLDQNVSWTADLGNAFLSQESGVMDAIQRMRQKAYDSGALKSTPQQTVSSMTENGQPCIVVQPASADVAYIPEYNPAAIWGPAEYPYPSIYYPVGAVALSFGVGVAVGAIWGNGWHGWNNWGWNAGWGHRNITVNNNFISSNRYNRVNVGAGNAWVHNPIHRGGVPYSNSGVANRFQGGGPQVATRPSVAQTQQRLSGMGGAGAANRAMPGSAGPRPGQPSIGGANRTAGGGLGQPGAGDRIGNRSVGAGAGQGAFGGINQGGARAMSSGNRGFSSFGGGGGGFRGGGFRGGGGGGRGGGRRR
jgi:Protein of unknown function (DUF3300)